MHLAFPKRLAVMADALEVATSTSWKTAIRSQFCGCGWMWVVQLQHDSKGRNPDIAYFLLSGSVSDPHHQHVINTKQSKHQFIALEQVWNMASRYRAHVQGLSIKLIKHPRMYLEYLKN